MTEYPDYQYPKRFNYQAIKDLAAANHCKVDDLLALAAKNDPFYTGRPAHISAARFFTEAYDKAGYTGKVHIRRVHYRLVSMEEPVKLPSPITWKDENKATRSTSVYINNDACWKFLCDAAKYARYLGMVDPDAFIDKKNQPPIIKANFDHPDPEPYYQVYEDDRINGYFMPGLPSLGTLPGELPGLPSFYAGGYQGIQQDYLVEVWAEKTTMNDILEPICRKYSANLVTGAGELSITAVREFMTRAQESGRPARILYVSDFDPAGIGMPISIARKIEFFQRNDGFGELDIVLQPIVLTADQVEHYDLPRIPVKSSDRRKGNFEAAHGEGQVELDALEAIHSGELAKIVTYAILQYYDPDLKEKAEEEQDNLQNDLDEMAEATRQYYSNEIESLQDDYQALQADFENTRNEFSELVKPFAPKIDDYNERLEAIKERARKLYGKLYDDLKDVNIDMDEYPLPEPDITGDPDGLLYESSRDYMTQLQAYKVQRSGDIAEIDE